MPNKYCNLDGGKLIKDEYSKINVGFDRVSDDMNNVNKRVNNIITTPVDSVSAQEIIDARGGKEVLNDRFTDIDGALDEIGLNLEQITNENTMPRVMTNLKTNKKYRYGYRVSASGIPQIISEEVI